MVWTTLNVPFTSNSEYEFKLKVWSWRCSGLTVLLGVFLFRWEMFSLFLYRACGVLALPGVLRPRPYQTKQQTFKPYKRLINGINGSERPWTHLTGRQRWFLESGLVGGSPKAWVKDASWSSECWSGVELSRGKHVKYIEGTVVATWGSTPTFLIFPGVGVSANRLLGGACLAVPYSISSCVCLVFFICCFQTDENKVYSFTHSSNGKISARVKPVMSLTLSSFSFSFSLWCWSHCCCTYSRNCCPLTWNTVPHSCSQMSIWAFRHFSSWNKDETQMLSYVLNWPTRRGTKFFNSTSWPWANSSAGQFSASLLWEGSHLCCWTLKGRCFFSKSKNKHVTTSGLRNTLCCNWKSLTSSSKYKVQLSRHFLTPSKSSLWSS